MRERRSLSPLPTRGRRQRQEPQDRHERRRAAGEGRGSRGQENRRSSRSLRLDQQSAQSRPQRRPQQQQQQQQHKVIQLHDNDADTANDAMIARLLQEQLNAPERPQMSTGPSSVASESRSAPRYIEVEHDATATTNSSTSTSNRDGSSVARSSDQNERKRYSISQLIASLESDDSSTASDLSPALGRRVRDFKFARNKRRERHGEQQPWGIFGLYAHLSEIRADLEWAEDAAWRRQNNEPYLSWNDFEKRRDKGIKNRPFFTYSFIFACTVMMIVTFSVNGWTVEPLNVNPLIGPSSDTLIEIGARQTSLIVNEDEWYRLFTPMFLHAGLVHYVINMLALWYIGGAFEMSHGFANAAIVFIIPAVGGTILSSIFLPQYISVGASGGIFGLIGGCLADIGINWDLLFLKTTTDEDSRLRHFMVLFWLFIDIVVNCALGMTPFIDNFSHLGGFVYGVCCGLSTIERLAVGFFSLTNGKFSEIRNTIVRFLGLIISVLLIMITTILLVQSDGETTPCHGCRYISCVPFPPGTDDKWWNCDDCDFVTADLFQSTDGSGLYTDVTIQCPSGEAEDIIIIDEGFTRKDDVRKQLPKYCRMFCDDVFK